MRKLLVDLGERSYPIFISAGLLDSSAQISPYIEGDEVMLVTNNTINELYGDKIRALLGKVKKVDSVVLPDGEAFKNLDTLNLIFDALLEQKHNRKTTLVALGGGVVGDMAGYAAASYQRGVNFIQIPTTLLSQVDSSVGGKTGVNHRLGKNMIGAFYQPKCVVIDTQVLHTLPKRELSAGLAEVIKYGLIADEEFFCWLEDNMDALLRRDNEALAQAIEVSCKIKAGIVAQDEKESGIRAILNLGHTFGHAIEAAQGYGVWLHGEAVAVGMVMACEMSVRLGWLDEGIAERTKALLLRADLPITPPQEMSPEIFLDYMSVDKKVLDGSLRLVLLKACGNAIVTNNFDRQALEDTLA